MILENIFLENYLLMGKYMNIGRLFKIWGGKLSLEIKGIRNIGMLLCKEYGKYRDRSRCLSLNNW